MSAIAETLLGWIAAEQDALVTLLARFVAIPSPNPPGDTRAAAAFLLEHLRAAGVPADLRAAKPVLPNIVATLGTGGPHLVLNGHIDVFPAGPAAGWTRDPFSGAVADGRVHGRGVADMKCGTAAAVATTVLLHRLGAKLPGRLTLTCVSDEETGGTYGAQWLLQSFPDECRGDCMLNGEPTAGTIRFGEKGTLRLIFEISTPGAHAAYTHLSRNAIRVAARLVADLAALESLVGEPPEGVQHAIAAGRGALDAALGAGAGAIMDRVTVSPGVIAGGVKINMLPGDCRLEVDIRLPVGLSHATLMAALNKILRRYPQARMTPVWTHSHEATFSDPAHPMVGILQNAAAGPLGGAPPQPVISLGASDAKHWRDAGVPSFLYGCHPNNMARADEYVDVAEYLHVLRVHALAAAAFLSGQAPFP